MPFFRGKYAGENLCMDSSERGNEYRRCVCWNVQGWFDFDRGQKERDVRQNDVCSHVILELQPDVLVLTETWLKGNERLGYGNILG